MRKKHRPVSSINVTPMVDVMLVLLIVFMVTAPLLTVGVPVNLPKVDANSLDAQKEPLEISINENNDIYLGEELITFEELILKVKIIAGNFKNVEVSFNDKMISLEDYANTKQVSCIVLPSGDCSDFRTADS